MRNREKSMKLCGLHDDFPGTTLMMIFLEQRISPRYIFLPNYPQTEFDLDSWLKNELLFSGHGQISVFDYAVVEEWAYILV